MENILVIGIDILNDFNVNNYNELYETIQSSEIGDFEEFCINAGAILNDYDYEILDDHWSDNPESLSYYIVSAKKDDIDNQNTKVIIHIRLSDHNFNNNTDEKQKARNIYYRKLSKQYQLPKDKQNQNWRFYNIVVNGHSYKHYDLALDKLENRLQKIENKFYLDED